MAELSKAYEPAAVEAKWYARWLADGCFKADLASPKLAYSIVIPPPNVTGVLTLGHVLNTTIQDILVRRARMLGKEVLWLPGMDHAGIATQTVVERQFRGIAIAVDSLQPCKFKNRRFAKRRQIKTEFCSTSEQLDIQFEDGIKNVSVSPSA